MLQFYTVQYGAKLQGASNNALELENWLAELASFVKSRANMNTVKSIAIIVKFQAKTAKYSTLKKIKREILRVVR